MPTYSYRCTECGTAFDIKQAFTDETLTECPTCGGVLRKVFSPVGVTFNGSGFYRTDSRSGGSGKSDGGGKDGGSSSGSSESGSSTSSGSESKSSSGSDSKPSAPATSAPSTSAPSAKPSGSSSSGSSSAA